MEDAITLLAIIQSFAVSLGVGASTMAILNFFVAIKDGNIDETERNFLGITYVVLRIAMVALLISALSLTVLKFSVLGPQSIGLPHTANAFLVAILFLNAFLMTAHVMPSTFGPSIQAGTWYSLGILAAVVSNGMIPTSVLTSILFYVAIIIGATAIVNGVIISLKRKKAS